MFTGIIEEVGRVVNIDRTDDTAVLRVQGPLAASDAAVGDSISVNGVCLTVTTVTDDSFTADVMGQTLRMSSLGALEVGSPVNLERAMRLGDRLGGHLVQGHVDATAVLLSRTAFPKWEVFRFSLPKPVSRYVVAKGSITIDGVSLTVSGLDDNNEWFEVSLIPTTLNETTLGSKQIGDVINLESDVIARHVERLLGVGNE